MTKFKFFRGYVGTLNVLDGQTYATASLYDPRTFTNDERLTQINRRIQIDEEMRNQIRMSQEQYNLNRDMFAQQEIVRRRPIDTNERIRLFQATTTITVNPTLWTKVKIFGTGVKLVLNSTWRSDPIGIVVVSTLLTLVTIIGIAKILSVF
jgi:hypothetical protein